jgi:hypothetical protein
MCMEAKPACIFSDPIPSPRPQPTVSILQVTDHYTKEPAYQAGSVRI